MSNLVENVLAVKSTVSTFDEKIENNPILKFNACGRISHNSTDKLFKGNISNNVSDEMTEEEITEMQDRIDSISNDSMVFDFIGGLIDRGELSVLEHYRIPLKMPIEAYNILNAIDSNINLKYFNVTIADNDKTKVYFSGNVRAYIDLFKSLDYTNQEVIDILYTVYKLVSNEIPNVFFVYERAYTEVNEIEIAKYDDMLIFNRIQHECKTFIISTNRGVTHEIVRHRVGSFTQKSTRYVRTNHLMTTSLEHVLNKGAMKNYSNWNKNVIAEHMNTHIKNVDDIQAKMVECGASKDLTRLVLPIGTQSEIAVTMTIYDWLFTFIPQRTYSGAHADIQFVANEIQNYFNKESKIKYEYIDLDMRNFYNKYISYSSYRYKEEDFSEDDDLPNVIQVDTLKTLEKILKVEDAILPDFVEVEENNKVYKIYEVNGYNTVGV